MQHQLAGLFITAVCGCTRRITIFAHRAWATHPSVPNLDKHDSPFGSGHYFPTSHAIFKISRWQLLAPAAKELVACVAGSWKGKRKRQHPGKGSRTRCKHRMPWWWAEKSKVPQQFGRSDTVRINVAVPKQSSETVTITLIATALHSINNQNHLKMWLSYWTVLCRRFIVTYWGTNSE